MRSWDLIHLAGGVYIPPSPVARAEGRALRLVAMEQSHEGEDERSQGGHAFIMRSGLGGMYTPPARWVKSQDHIAQRPALVRWNRDAESIYKLKEIMKVMLLRGARPFKVKLYLVCLNSNCFDLQPVICILILITPPEVANTGPGF